jgi:hypothetical protein
MKKETVDKIFKKLIKESLCQGKETDKLVHEALARGGRTLVLDENIMELRDLLRNKNYTVNVAHGVDAEILEDQVRNHIFLTNNASDFDDEDLQKLCYYGLVLTPNPNDFDSKLMADAIEKVLMQANFAGNLIQTWQITQDYKFSKVR